MNERVEAPGSVDELTRGWEGRDPDEWTGSPEHHLVFGRAAVALGQPALAVDILNEGIHRFPGAPELAYYASLALANCGSVSQAEARVGPLLDQLSPAHPLLSEALSLAGRIAKEHWTKLPGTEEGRAALGRAASFYGRAHAIAGDTFPGINAASMNVLGGHVDEGLRIAREVKRRCLELGSPDHWIAATLGEACLLLGETEEAVRWYGQAVKAAGARLGDIASMRRQMKMLSGAISVAPEVIAALAIPNVAVFVGHMIDAPNRAEPRFPERIVPEVASAIGRAIADRHLGIGYCSLACGADILFVERMHEDGHETNVILPFRREDFVATSVAFAGPHWVERFEAALRMATRVTYAVDEGYLGDGILFDYTSRLLQGAAILRAAQLGVEPHLLAALDEGGGEAAGGSVATLRDWRRLGGKEEIIDLASLRASSSIAHTVAAEPAPPPFEVDPAVWEKRKICTMLFADMVGFSRLAETEAPSFIVHFLGETAKVIRESRPGPAFWNTWGDGLFLVFDEVEVAAGFALRLRDTVLRYDWGSAGLPEETSIRIGMHTGPVFPAEDPVIERRNFFGSHVNRAARIEPVTAAGAIYVSEQTAALLTASGDGRFACDYLGEQVLAKSFGTRSLYRLRHAGAVE